MGATRNRRNDSPEVVDMASLDSLLLSTQGVTKRFGGLTAVDHVDFGLRHGEIHALIGANGAGKTSFVNVICGLMRADSGKVIFDAEDITNLAPHKRVQRGIGYSFHHSDSLFSGLSVYDNLALAVQRCLQWRGRSLRRHLDNEIMVILERVGLRDSASCLAGVLSYGSQRILEFAMVLALRPRLLILDEAARGLSDAEIGKFKEVVRAFDGSVLLIEHNMEVVLDLAVGITVLDRGGVLASGSVAEVRANSAVQKAYLGDYLGADIVAG